MGSWCQPFCRSPATLALVLVVLLSPVVPAADSRLEDSHDVCVSGDCYSVQEFTEPASRSSAKTHCTDGGNDLAAILSVKAQETLMTTLEDEAWVGLAATPQNKPWWLVADGWRQGSLPEGVVTGTDGCVRMNRDYMELYDCTAQITYLCEYASEPDSPPAGCVEIPEGLGDKWLCHGTRQRSWVDAAKDCSRNGGSLLSILSANELVETKAMYRRQSSLWHLQVWVGGTRVPLLWDQDVEINPYSLVWDGSLADNPNIQQAVDGFYDLCITLSDLGLRLKRCVAQIAVICSEGPSKGEDNTVPNLVWYIVGGCAGFVIFVVVIGGSCAACKKRRRAARNRNAEQPYPVQHNRNAEQPYPVQHNRNAEPGDPDNDSEPESPPNEAATGLLARLLALRIMMRGAMQRSAPQPQVPMIRLNLNPSGYGSNAPSTSNLSIISGQVPTPTAVSTRVLRQVTIASTPTGTVTAGRTIILRST